MKLDMDPEKILVQVLQALATSEFEVAQIKAHELAEWLSKGGYPPQRSAYSTLVDLSLAIARNPQLTQAREKNPGDPRDIAQEFWNLFRMRLRVNLRDWQDRLDKCSTVWRLLSAREACEIYAGRHGLGPSVRAVWEYPLPRSNYRVDVAAINVNTRHSLVLFESELGRPNRSKHPWTEEFKKLCEQCATAELRVLSGVYGKGEGPGLHDVLNNAITPYRNDFEAGPRGSFLLVFGPESRKNDPGQDWRAYYLDPGFLLHELDSPAPPIYSAE
jgi:hypothetical protein